MQKKPIRVSLQKKTGARTTPVRRGSWQRRTAIAIGVCVWTVFWFYVTQLAIQLLLQGLLQLGVPLASYNKVAVQAILTALVYVATIFCVLYIPAKWYKKKVTLHDIGMEQRLPAWRDMGIAPLVYIASLLVSAGVLIIVSKLLPHFDITQTQAVGFTATTITQRYELLLVYVTLAVIAPVAEELLFRGYLFGRVRQQLSAAATIVLTAVVFSVLHLGIGQLESLQWNIAIATFVLGLSIGIAREVTGSVWAGIIIHMIQNTIAFLVLFAVPVIFRIGL